MPIIWIFFPSQFIALFKLECVIRGIESICFSFKVSKWIHWILSIDKIQTPNKQINQNQKIKRTNHESIYLLIVFATASI